ncbi:hypothetical protein DHD05_01350 [Arenibacter sp. N53]|nr:hypothetical protein [Arenibacter sp. N53]
MAILFWAIALQPFGPLRINVIHISLNRAYTNENRAFTTNNFFMALTDLVLALVIIYIVFVDSYGSYVLNFTDTGIFKKIDSLDFSN